MVDILCPHCEEEIELEDDASGEFACPFCDGEFEWNMQPQMQAMPSGGRPADLVGGHRLADQDPARERTAAERGRDGVPQTAKGGG